MLAILDHDVPDAPKKPRTTGGDAGGDLEDTDSLDGAEVVKKRPAGKSVLTEAAVEAKNEADTVQNDQMNSCLNQAVKMLQQRHLNVMALSVRLKSLEVTGVQIALKDAIAKELSSAEECIQMEIAIMQKSWVEQQDIKQKHKNKKKTKPPKKQKTNRTSSTWKTRRLS